MESTTSGRIDLPELCRWNTHNHTEKAESSAKKASAPTRRPFPFPGIYFSLVKGRLTKRDGRGTFSIKGELSTSAPP